MDGLKRRPQGSFPFRASLVSRFESRKLLILMVVVITAITIDSQIGYIADFIPEKVSSDAGVATFILMAVIFAVTQYFILGYVKQTSKDNRPRAKALHLGITHSIVSIAQFVLVAILAFVIVQIIIFQQYNILTIYASYVISFGLWIATLGLLAKAFFSWYWLSNKNFMVLILALSMIAFVFNGAAYIVYSISVLSEQKPIVTSEDIAYFPEFDAETLVGQTNVVSQASNIISYILIWIGTVKLLYPYIRKFGRIKFWAIMVAPMVYYLINFPLFVLGFFTPSENSDAMTNIIIFNFAAIFTGIIFGVAFLSVAKTLKKDSELRNYMIIAAWGFTLFYIAGSATASQAAYPPYGLASISFVGLSCYLIYSGLYSSAVTVSQDIALRNSIKKSVNEQSKLLHGMGRAQMQQELESKVLTINKKVSDMMEKETGVEPSMTEEDIKEHIEMVRKEINK
jgi:MFS family permease